MSATSTTSSSSRSFNRVPNRAPPQQHHTKPDLDITKEELNRFSEALKQEEFRKLFLEYCEEIQDPENRKKYEEEIKQFEKERGVDVVFVNPQPGFVIKTSEGGEQKCFVNVAKNEAIAKPTSQVSVNHENGERGITWSIPMAQSPPRDDIDAHKKPCRVYDVIFHPDALYLAERNEAFRKCLIDTALDAVEREYAVKLDRTNLKFPKLQFKGISRPTVIRKMSTNPPADAFDPHPLDHIYPARPTANSSEAKVLPLKTSVEPKPEFTTPKHIIKHRRDVDLTEYTDEMDAKMNVTIPRDLIVEIELPLLKSTAECQLDVTAHSIYLLSERAGAKYRLQLDLPYVVDDKRGNARFETDTRKLCITLPVLKKNENTSKLLNAVLLNREDSGVESDMRDESNSSHSESPIEELSSEHAEEEDVSSPPEDVIAKPSPKAPFLKNSIQYQFPSKFDCNVLDNVMSLVLDVRNVQQESIAILKEDHHIHLQFVSIGSGYFPTHYAFYLQIPHEEQTLGIRIESGEAEAWENNVVLNVHLAANQSENLQNYLAGMDVRDLKEYSIQGKFQVAHKSRQRKKSPPLMGTSGELSSSKASTFEISVERSECEKAVEIEIKPRDHHASTSCAANTTEDEEQRSEAATQQSQKKLNKKQKKHKNKKRRSLSESACDDIKAYHAVAASKAPSLPTSAAAAAAAAEVKQTNEEYNSSPERRDEDATKGSSSMAVPVGGGGFAAQQRKQRSFSECRDSAVGSVGSTLPPSFKGILKHYSRYAPRPSISDSCSSIDECSSYACSVETPGVRFSHSFTGIPEEQSTIEEMSESCKKTVRFNEHIMKQVFRLDSSILGQRKKNQKRRDRKQKALQRRHSEGDSADYEDNSKPIELHNPSQYLKQKGGSKNTTTTNTNDNQNQPLKSTANLNKKPSQHDSGLDLTGNCNAKNKNPKNSNKHHKLSMATRQESESSDVDLNKNSMMFEMDDDM